MVPYSRRIRAITGVRSGGFRLSAHARRAWSLSLRQGRKLYAELIEIGVVLARVVVELLHLWPIPLHGLAIEVDLRLIGVRQQRQDLVVLELNVGEICLGRLD